jgi:NMD protein affecting ribosome stability and mRNA decay
MSTAPQPSQGATARPRVLRYCRHCERETPHEIHAADGMNIAVCVRCVERARFYELERD